MTDFLLTCEKHITRKKIFIQPHTWVSRLKKEFSLSKKYLKLNWLYCFVNYDKLLDFRYWCHKIWLTQLNWNDEFIFWDWWKRGKLWARIIIDAAADCRRLSSPTTARAFTWIRPSFYCWSTIIVWHIIIARKQDKTGRCVEKYFRSRIWFKWGYIYCSL